MQLKEKPVRHALALATCALLGGEAAAASASKTTHVDSSVLFYSEVDRVNVVEPVMFFKSDDGQDNITTVRVVYDVLSGASPNGAVPTATAQTFTGASGGTGYTVPAFEQPKRDFSDTRVALGVDWDRRVSSDLRRATSLNLSKEEDYFSVGGNLTFAREFNQKLTTVALGAGVSLDAVQPHGGAPRGLTLISATPETTTSASGRASLRDDDDDDDDDDHDDDDGEGFSGERKTVLDFMVGITQVLSRRTLMQVNLSRSHSSGYLTDPYKLLSMVDPVTGETLDYVYEKRPSERTADIGYVKLAHHFGRDVMHTSYRYFTDDWGINSHTVEVSYRWQPSQRVYVEPQYRWYNQTAAEFFRYFVVNGEMLSAASADQRLADMTSTTLGLKVGIRWDAAELTFRAASMRQEGREVDEAFGAMAGMDLHPDMDATQYTVGFSTKW